MGRSERPVQAVDGIVYREGDIVLIYRENEPKGWALPGGKVEYGEKLEKACRREIKEETGLEVEIKETEGPTKEFGVYDDPDRDPRGRVISTVFVCKSIGGKLKADTDAQKADTLPLKEALDLDLTFDHDRILKEFYNFY